MELIYYCAIENVSVTDGKLISFEKYFGRDVNFEINALTEEEKKNIELLKKELIKCGSGDGEIDNIISLYFYTCRFNIDTYIASIMNDPIDYFLWVFNKRLPSIQNKDQKFIDLMKKINDKIGNLKGKEFFNSEDNLAFFKYLREDQKTTTTNLKLKFKNVKDRKDLTFRIMPCIFFNIKNLDIKKIKGNGYFNFSMRLLQDQTLQSTLNEEETIEYIKNNFMSEAASSSMKKKISIGILLFIIVLIGTYFLLNKKHMNIYKTMKKPIRISEI